MTSLPRAFLDAPIAHRGLHGAGRAENGMAAILAAADAGYGIEVDIHQASDGVPVVFHDATLDRLTDARGAVRDRTSAALAALPLDAHGTIPRLADVLLRLSGRAPLLVEIKDQSGRFDEATDGLARAVAAELSGYAGPAAIMSFNPHAAHAAARAAPDRAVGLVTSAFEAEDWPGLDAEDRERLAAFDTHPFAPDFISHDVRDLANPRVAAFRSEGRPVLTWTIRSEAAETDARRHADQVTFEGYAATARPA